MRSTTLVLLILSLSLGLLLVESCTTMGKAQSAATKFDNAAGDVAIAAHVIKDAATAFKPPPPNPDGSTNIGAWAVSIYGALSTVYGEYQRRKKETATRAATALVDAAEALPPEHRETYKAEAASSVHMGAAETALIATLKAR